MAHITEFTIAGLAGRTKEYHKKLDPQVNVFFGLNGSGKTSLLKILDSAMSGDASSLANVPFRSAEVNVYSVTYDHTYTYTVTKKTVREPPPALAEHAESVRRHEAPLRLAVERATPSTPMPDWTVAPTPPRDARGWSHRYLPTSRLYMGLQSFIRSSYRESVISEDQLDQLFAESLQTLWQNYSAALVTDINRAQQDGLARILKAVLAGKKPTRRARKAIDIRTAYQRMSDFLTRQGSRDIIGPLRRFETQYNDNPQLQNVVSDIDLTEQKIAEITAPRTRLESLIHGMFSGNKTVLFKDMSIEVETKDKQNIGVARLSSGEKHALMLFIEAARSERAALLVDEPELSMHIDWQRDLVPTMHLLSPTTQLILATHSPDIMANVDDKRIFRL